MTTTQTIDNKTTLLDPQKLAELKTFVATLKTQEHPESQLISALHKTQEIFGYIPTAAMDEIAQEMGIPTAHIWGVATFYHYFKLSPPGAHVISVCLGTACYVKGAAQILQAVKDELKIDFGQVTADGLFSLEEARCLGACGLAPVVMIDDRIHGELTPKKIVQILNQYRKEQKSVKCKV
jgi:NADH:ubiquinone oxidoreductase subunit E